MVWSNDFEIGDLWTSVKVGGVDDLEQTPRPVFLFAFFN